ncbi:hypothetical protein RM780_23835 [Streptomyces sp. DSM 44917]|uniref:Uncharacterized protein n=1 Tax=Streptomyces boetiae TaxID=3075541 RepID=A0ABU2LEH2_9ACTN|nr:hypothetical protein [Streptomyces sp. DSM 44917]MDT0309961.1 hypothetical protein [Streptomyces sp. DSM 44917]
MTRRPGASPPAWIPRDESGPQLLACGELFDAVRVRVGLAPYVLARLNSASGPVIQDACVWTWLVEPGSARKWSVRGAEIAFGDGAVLVPPLRPEPRTLPRWILPGATPTYLTDPGPLRAALTALAGGPHDA